jgi:predicted nuclease with RNAse H fold
MFLNINMKVVGIDLAGKSQNATGFCLLTESGAETKLLYSDLDILKEIENTKPDCIAIDAPFWLPKFGAWRPSEERLLRRGFQPISPLFPTMRILVLRASHLVRVLSERKYKVIEVFSQASEKILGLSKEPRKNKDEYDALLCALTAKAYLEGKYEDLDGIIIPK